MIKQRWWSRIKPYVDVFDGPLLIILTVLVSVSLLTMFSSAYDFPGRMQGHLRNLLLAALVMWIVSLCSPQALMRAAVPIYVAGLVLLVLVELAGVTKKGATRWLDLGPINIQPSEIMKIGLPLLLAWYFHKREAVLQWKDYVIATLLLVFPTILILKQPDLGTAILVFSSGFAVIFFAGLSWKILTGLILTGLASLPLVWTLMHDYQRQRVLTLLDPGSD
ncbi:MAG: FtsW/RodA/SpoVE family cell cycle protein, partial [Burkholderiaceae bacterium]